MKHKRECEICHSPIDLVYIEAKNNEGEVVKAKVTVCKRCSSEISNKVIKEVRRC